MSASMPLQALWTWRDAKIRQCVRGHSGEGGGGGGRGGGGGAGGGEKGGERGGGGEGGG